jgi:hypothetical protein
MSAVTALKPDADQWTLSIFLFCLYWIIYAVSNWAADYVHTMAFPHLAELLPYSVSLPPDLVDNFQSYWQEVDRSRLHVVSVKIAISYVFCYLAACFLVHIMSSGHDPEAE